MVRKSGSPRDGGKVFGIGSDWRPDYPAPEAFRAWWLWRQSGRTRYPTREEVSALPEEWIADIHLVESIAEWVTNDSMLMTAFTKHMADQKSGPG